MPIHDIVASLYNTGLTLAEIAERLGTSSESVRRQLLAAGIPRRPRGQPVGKHRPKEGRIVDGDGYTLLRAPEHPATVNGYAPEHRLIMEGVLGRLLERHEVVAHKNGNKADNRQENLELFASMSTYAQEALKRNSRARGDVGNPKRRVRRKRTPEQILWELAALRWTLRRNIRRSDLVPPRPSWRAVQRAFGSWQHGVAEALRVYPEATFLRLTLSNRHDSNGDRAA